MNRRKATRKEHRAYKHVPEIAVNFAPFAPLICGPVGKSDSDF